MTTALATPAVGRDGWIGWTELATLVVVFLVYSNAPVVGVKFHGLPFVVGALAVAPLLLPLAHDLLVRRLPLVVTPALPFAIGFIAVATFSAAVSRDPGAAQGNLNEELQGLTIFILLTNVVRTAATLRRVAWTLLLVGALLGGIGVHQQMTGSFHSNYGGFSQGGDKAEFRADATDRDANQPRLSGPIGEKNRYAQIMLMLVPLGIMLSMTPTSSRARLLAIGGTVLTALGCTLAFSRGAALGFVLMLAVMALLGYLRLRQMVAVAVVVVLALAAFPQYANRLASFQTIWAVATGTQRSSDSLDGAARGRLTEIRAAALVYADYPVVGVGPGMFPSYSQEYGNEGGLRLLQSNRQAHNLFVSVAAETGTLGLACFLGMVFVTMVGLARTRRRFVHSDPLLADLATGFLLALVCYLSTGLNLHFSYTRYFWLMLGLAAAAAAVRSHEDAFPTTGAVLPATAPSVS